MTPCNFEQRIEKLARCRAVVLQAINHTPGMTYSQIREWVRKHKGFYMEQVGARCRELYYSNYAVRKTGEDNRVHVYPAKEGAEK